MKKNLLYVALLLPTFLCAAERSVMDAAALAAEFMNEQYAQSPARKASCSATSFILSHTRAKLNSEAPAFYVFNKSNNDGYVIISADDRTEDVLVYSENGSIDMDNINPNFRFWLNRLQEEISAANDENTYTAAEKKARKATAAVTAISPLLKNSAGEEIAWYQEEPYWNQCPMDLWKTSERCLTGCVATAAAQIMYKWRYPAKGTGSHSYTWKCCMNSQCSKTSSKTLSKDFSTVTFDWDNMLATYNSGASGTTAQKNAVATLMSCCGIACDMEYGGNTIGGSGAYTDVMAVGLSSYFDYTYDYFITTYSEEGYGTAVTPANKTKYSVKTSDFKTYFNSDLEAGRPILMGGEDSDGGHEFVCDGRNTSGYFHINWGWEGESNNYCQLSALKPSKTSYDFSSNLDALIGLEPNITVDTIHVTGVTVSPTKLELKQKEKSTLTATVAPTDATDKTVTWSSSNNSIATVSESGVVTGVAKGNVTITATSKDGGKNATCAVTVTDEIIETSDCEEYYYEFKSKCAKGSNTLGTYTWNISLAAGDVNNVDADRGQQFGSKNTPAETVSLTTSNVSECLVNKIKINAAMAKDGDAKLAVYINGTQIGTTSLTTTATEYTFDNADNVQGNLEIRLTNTKRAMYIKSINVNPADSPTDLDDQLSDSPIHRITKVIINGQLYIQSGENIYNAQGQLVR